MVAARVWAANECMASKYWTPTEEVDNAAHRMGQAGCAGADESSLYCLPDPGMREVVELSPADGTAIHSFCGRRTGYYLKMVFVPRNIMIRISARDSSALTEDLCDKA